MSKCRGGDAGGVNVGRAVRMITLKEFQANKKRIVVAKRQSRFG